MHALNISWADIAVVAVVVVSTILAVARGFVRETLSILAWAAAAAATLYFGPYFAKVLGARISTPLLGPMSGLCRHLSRRAHTALLCQLPAFRTRAQFADRCAGPLAWRAIRSRPWPCADRHCVSGRFAGDTCASPAGVADAGAAITSDSAVERCHPVILPTRTHLPQAVTSLGGHARPPASAPGTPAKKTDQADVRRALDHLIAAARSSGSNEQ